MNWLSSSPQTSEFDDQHPAEPVIDEVNFFLLEQSFLKCQHSPVTAKIEHVDELIKVQAHAALVDGKRTADTGFLEIEGLRIVLPVFDGIPAIAGGHHSYLFEQFSIHMQGNLEVLKVANRSDGIFWCGSPKI